MFRPFLHPLAFGLLAACASLAAAQNFPSKPITLIVPLPPGGATDVQARALAQAASKELGQPIVILNKPGVAGTFGPSTMAQSSAPDGYTVSLMPASVFRIPHLQKVSYDPVNDFTYVIGVTSYVFGVTVASGAEWKNAAEFIAHAKANPGKVSYSATGKGSSGHLSMERLANSAGMQLNFVPFKGVAEQFTSLMGRHIDAVSDAGFGETVDSGKGRLLMTFTESRLKRYPNVPTAKELGHNIVIRSPWGIAGPKGMDPKTVQVLHDAFRKAMNDPAFVRSVEINGQPLTYMSSREYAKFAEEQTIEDKKFITELNIKLE